VPFPAAAVVDETALLVTLYSTSLSRPAAVDFSLDPGSTWDDARPPRADADCWGTCLSALVEPALSDLRDDDDSLRTHSHIHRCKIKRSNENFKNVKNVTKIQKTFVNVIKNVSSS